MKKAARLVLPCFFARLAIYAMGRDIRELKKKIVELEAGTHATR